ncbi:MAG: chromosomal replication initiator protein DnaA [Candidatus Gracilibacteria bacterium]|nr:chromosomal replication initiator protein DnaA [Candidatus Gracilibacteria bacterium]
MKNFYHLRNILKEITQNIKKQDFLVYFKKMTILETTQTRVVFGVISDFMKGNLTAKFYDEIFEATKIEFPLLEEVIFDVDDNIENPSNSQVVDCLAFYKELTKAKKKTKKQENKASILETKYSVGNQKKATKSRYTLQNFIVGSDNQLAYSACTAISKAPGKAYNPVYVYGDVGLGKTHLLQGTGNEITKKFKDKKVLYTTADKFLNEYVSCVKNRTIDKLRAKFKGADVLIIDDVQFLENKKQTQNELYNIFNILYDTDRQIILSGDRPPKELTELEPRLRSRFEWGITIDIGKPDFETRLAILQEKARSREFMLSQDVAEFIAANVTENVRELEGILNQLIVEYELDGAVPTLEKVAKKLKKLSYTDDLLGYGKMRAPKIKSYEDLLDAVSEHFGIEKEGILGGNRKKEFMIPRQVAMYLLKTKMSYTYERIGNIFSGRNHASVLYSCNKLESLMKKNKDILYEVNQIRERVGL